jgi:serine/threonine-protein kinase
VKELAPVGVKRRKDGILELDQSGASGHMLRHRFLQEAGTIRRLHHPGIPSLRAAFAENGTAYYVTSYLPGGRTLEDRIRREGPLGEEEAREIFASLLDILEVVHAANVLHRDVKPSNVLLGPAGEVILLDFGAARDWATGAAITHTVMHTPGYAPPEQLSEKAARGAATDLYALCATTYHALAGKPPPTAPDRIAGIPLVSILNLRPGLDPAFAAAIEAGLAIRMTDRPASVAEMRARLADEGSASAEQSLNRLDDVLVRLKQFRFDRRACPACDGMLDEPRPLKRLACPVCHEGMIRPRDLDERLCPACRSGILADLDNTSPLAICPICSVGVLAYRRKSLLATAKVADCPSCQTHFEAEGDRMCGPAEALTCDEWRLRSGRGRHVKRCPDCSAQFDETPDGRWRLVAPPQDGKAVGRGALYWDDWVRLAAGLEPGAGNAACDACDADFWQEDNRLTLLDAARDPFRFAGRYVGRPLGIEDARWLGVGKSSAQPGLLCEQCATEFDRDGGRLRLVASPSRRLNLHVDDTRTLEDWHRIAQDLPTTDQESALTAKIEPILMEAYSRGEVAFDAQGALWRGKATRLDDGAEAVLTVTEEEISFGGRLRRWRVPTEALIDAEVADDVLTLHFSGQPEPVEFQVVPITLTAHLKSGDHAVELTAENLAERLQQVHGRSA